MVLALKRSSAAGLISLHLHTGGNAAACVEVYVEAALAGTPIPLAIVINNPGLVNEIKRVSPETFVVCRVGVVEGQDILPLTPNNPEANKNAGRARFAQRYVVCNADAYQIANEHYDKSHPAWMVEAMAFFYVGAMEAAEILETRVLVGDFAVGGPEDEHLPLLAPMLSRAERNGHPLNYHGYCKPGVFDITTDAEWFAMRWQRIAANYPNLLIVIGECGGYSTNGPDIMGMMKIYQRLLAPFWQVIGAAVFTANAAPDWIAAGCGFDPYLNEYLTWFKSLGKGKPMAAYTSPVDPSTNELIAGGWYDATGFARKYSTSAVAQAYHTGADMNLAKDADANKPVYSIADGTVTAVRKHSTWGWVIVIHHTPTGGPHVYARYAHVKGIRVTEGQQVQRGAQIAQVGNAEGLQPYHLHFDISPTDILFWNPSHWPGLNLAEVKEHYADPVAFHRGQVTITPPSKTIRVFTIDNLRLRALPNTACTTMTIFEKGAGVEAVEYNASWYKRVEGGYLSRQYAKPDVITPIPEPSPITAYVDATDGLNVRSGPGTTYTIIAGLKHREAVEVTIYNASWYKRVEGGYIFRTYTSLTKPPASTAWQPPIPATKRGVHANAGGWSPLTTSVDLDLVSANRIKAVLIPAYEPNQQVAISRFRDVGVEHFIIRACVHGIASLKPQNFLNITLPILHQYAAAIGGTKDLMIALGNEPNLVKEGWGTEWQNGAEFAAWWRLIAETYRREFAGCKVGFPAMSPGGSVPNVRTDEATFIKQATSAVNDADWIGVHYYWQKEDGSDINPPIANWRKWYGDKALIGTEVGPADATTITSLAVTRSYDTFARIGVPPFGWVLNGAGDWKNGAWDLHNIRA